jgi:outer membrane protein OmpA-like peptidoglycan-associated protein
MVRHVWRRGLVLAAAQLALTAVPAMSQSATQPADSFSSDELVCALNPKCGAERAGPAMAQSAPQQADSFSKEELVCALDPKCGADRVMIRRRGITISQPELSRRAAPPPYFTNITFDFDSAELTNGAQAMLDRIAVALHDPSVMTLAYRIEGHTDAKGTIAYNQILSERRADAVRNYLVTMGISKGRLTAVGFGKTRPLPNPPAASPYAPINRRVQFSWIDAGR